MIGNDYHAPDRLTAVPRRRLSRTDRGHLEVAHDAVERLVVRRPERPSLARCGKPPPGLVAPIVTVDVIIARRLSSPPMIRGASATGRPRRSFGGRARGSSRSTSSALRRESLPSSTQRSLSRICGSHRATAGEALGGSRGAAQRPDRRSVAPLPRLERRRRPRRRDR